MISPSARPSPTHADIRKLRDELRQARQEDLVGKCRCAADRQRPGRLAAGELVGRLGKNAQRLIDQGRINFAGAGKPQSPRFAIEQLDAEPIFEGLDACARRQVQFIGGFPEAVVSRSCLEHPKRTQWWKPKGHAADPIQSVSFDTIKRLQGPANATP
jgi:hypothetical protein